MFPQNLHKVNMAGKHYPNVLPLTSALQSDIRKLVIQGAILAILQTQSVLVIQWGNVNCSSLLNSYFGAKFMQFKVLMPWTAMLCTSNITLQFDLIIADISGSVLFNGDLSWCIGFSHMKLLLICIQVYSTFDNRIKISNHNALSRGKVLQK